MSTCAICFDAPNQPTIVLPCKHQFCNSCIIQWQRSSNACPCCRGTMRNFTPGRKDRKGRNDLRNGSIFSVRFLRATSLLIFIISFLIYLIMDSLTTQSDTRESGVTLHTSTTSSTGLLHYLLYPLTLCTIVKDFLLTILYYIALPFYYIGWVIWCLMYCLYVLLYTPMTHIYSLISFLCTWIWYAVCSLASWVAAVPINQLLQPSLDSILILCYILWDFVTDVVYLVCGLLLPPISLIKNLIVIFSLTLCIIIYRVIFNLVWVVSVLVLSLTDVGLAVLPVFVCLLLIFVVAITLGFVLDKLLTIDLIFLFKHIYSIERIGYKLSNLVKPSPINCSIVSSRISENGTMQKDTLLI